VLQTIDGDYWLTTSDRLYALYFLTLIVACLAASIRVFKVWQFRRRLQDTTSSTKYLKNIQEGLLSLQQWRGFIFITWGIVVAVNFREALRALREFAWRGSLGSRDVALLLFDLRNVTSSLIAALVASALLYIARWYLLKTIERAKTNPAAQV
jgi:hypothetical protein